MTEPLVDRVARAVTEHRRVVVVFLVALLALAASALPRLNFETGVDPFLDRSLPEHHFYDELKKRFVSDEVVVVAYEAPDLFAAASLRAVRELGDELLALRVGADQFPPIVRVDSLATLKDLVGSDLSYRSEPLVPEPIPEEVQGLQHIRARAHKNPLIRENYLSRDGGMAALVLRLNPDFRDVHNGPMIAAIRQAVEGAKVRAGWSQVHLTGKRVVLNEISKAVSRDVKRFIPAALVCMLFILAVLVRRVLGAALVLVTMVLCLVVGVSVMPLLDIPVTYMISVLYPLILMLACATSVHFLSELGQHAARGGPDVHRRTLSGLLVPSAMCTFTTMVGFGSVGTSSIPGLRDFAIASPVVVLVVFVVTFGVMAVATQWRPAGSWMSPSTLTQSPLYHRFVDAYWRVLRGNAKLFLAFTVVLCAVAAAGIPRLLIDSNVVEDLGRKDVPIRVTTEVVESRMAGIESLVVSIQATEEGRFLEPLALRKLEALETYLRGELAMEQVTSLTGFIKLMHQGFFSEDRKEYRIPDTREQVAQLLTLNGDRKLDEFVDPNRKWVRLTARYREHSSVKQLALFDALDGKLRELFPAAEGYQPAISGDSRMRILANQRVVESQTTGLGLAFLIIFGPIFLVLRSFRAGLLSIPSNLFPILAVVGLMGWLGIRVTPQNTVMASVTLGMVVDDSIHFLHHLQERLRLGDKLEDALLDTLRTKVAAVLVATFVFALGFSVLMVSEFPPVVWFGFLIGLSMLLGLVGELAVLPPLILVLRPNLVPARTAPARVPEVVASK